MIYILTAIFGLIAGSFLNAWIYRMEKGESVLRGRSKCPNCGRVLSAAELIPLVSYLVQRGRCRGCKKAISAHYPAIELVLAMLFILIAWKHLGTGATSCVPVFGSCFEPGLIRDAIFFVFLAAIFIFDFKHSLVPDQAVLPGIAVAFLWNLAGGIGFFNLLTATATGAGFFFLQYAISRGRWIGGGDIRIGAMMGAMLGWPNIIPAIFLSYLLGAGVSLGLLGLRRVAWKSAIPFGTFLSIGTSVMLLWGNRIVGWYLSRIGY